MIKKEKNHKYALGSNSIYATLTTSLNNGWSRPLNARQSCSRRHNAMGPIRSTDTHDAHDYIMAWNSSVDKGPHLSVECQTPRSNIKIQRRSPTWRSNVNSTATRMIIIMMKIMVMIAIMMITVIVIAIMITTIIMIIILIILILYEYSFQYNYRFNNQHMFHIQQ